MKLVKAKEYDHRRLEATEMWCYRRMLRISWREIMTNKSMLDEIRTRRELLAQIIKMKMTSMHAEMISVIL